MRRGARRIARGFTLLEMLVVLVITSLVSSVLMGGLQHVLWLQDSFGAEAFDAQQGAMQTAWFRQTLNAVVPDRDKAPHAFRGESRECGGLTIAPLDLPEGTLAPFAWRLKFDAASGRTQLLYGTGDDAPEILSWPGNSGAFEYVDANGEAHDTWPPFLGQWPQLPSEVRLRRSADAPLLIAVPKGPLTPPTRLHDVEA
ncbi:MAG: type II secretion system protein J [Betaproteobacteria bacterium]